MLTVATSKERDMTLVTLIQQGLSRVWTSDRTLTASALLMLVALAAFLVGLVIDSRVITGVPAWLKPASSSSRGGC